MVYNRTNVYEISWYLYMYIYVYSRSQVSWKSANFLETWWWPNFSFSFFRQDDRPEAVAKLGHPESLVARRAINQYRQGLACAMLSPPLLSTFNHLTLDMLRRKLSAYSSKSVGQEHIDILWFSGKRILGVPFVASAFNLDILSLHPILFHVRSRSACVATFLLPPWECQQQQGAPDMLRTEYRLLDDEVKPAETVAVVLRAVSCNFTFKAFTCSAKCLSLAPCVGMVDR